MSSSNGASQWFVGVDVGGTFTDLLALDQTSGATVVAKELTTPDDPLRGIEAVLRKAFGEDLQVLAHCSGLLHATTLATNTLIERTGASTAMLTTKGFRDVIETGREDRYDLFDLQIDAPPTLVPREKRLPVDERVDARGQVVRPIDTEGLRRTVRRLAKQGIDAVAICFLNSYTNNDHELAAVAVVRDELPDAYISVSSNVAPIVREYERFLATAINSFIGPTVSRYLGSLSEVLSGHGFRGELGIMKSDGGVCSPAEASRVPVRMLESGPAAGATFAAHLAGACGLPKVLAFDMGGTTAKACLILDGSPLLTDELEVDRRVRLRPGSGFPLRVASVDLIEIGAGGGSIAGIGSMGLLRVGPESAGARPGPACYGIGGSNPTVTDADLVLGFLRADSFTAGGPTLDRDAAVGAIDREVRSPLALGSTELAAWAIHDLVNENMAQAARLACIEHAIDPAAVWVVATGGAGPLHAGGLLAKLQCLGVVYPQRAGVASAAGLVLAPWSVERTVTEIRPVRSLGPADVDQRFLALAEALERSLPASTSEGGTVELLRQVHMRVRGQAYEVNVPVPSPFSTGELEDRFRASYRERFGLEPSGEDFEVVSWSVRRIETSDRELVPDRVDGVARQESRRVFFGPEAGWCEALVTDYSSFTPGRVLVGPMLVEDSTTTIVVHIDQEATLDDRGNLRVTRRGSETR